MRIPGARVCTPFLALALLFAAAPALAQPKKAPAVPPAPPSRIVVTEDADYFGYDLKTVKEVELEACKSACLGDSACRAFTYNRKARWCFLKSDHGELRAAPGAVAGRKSENGETPAAQVPRLAFLPGNMELEARRLALRLRQTPGGPSPQKTSQLLAAAAAAAKAGDPRLAAENYRAVLVRGPSLEAWSGLARALLATSAANYREQIELLSEAALAALNGYFAGSDLKARAEPLSLLAAALERQQLYRPALEAYKASLAGSDSAAVRAAFERLRAERGFRVADYSVDADAASPRLCVQFSEPLLARFGDYGQYVTLDEKPAPAVEVEERQLCIDGLAHGQRYRLVLRAGLPSAVDEALTAPVPLNVYIRDRSPSVRFSGQNYVLPQTGAHTIPLVSVNSDAVAVSLYRIADRALARAITEGDFLSQLDGFSADRLAQQLGRELWSGILEVESRLNKEVTTGFPVDDALKERAPGVYVMVAQPDGARLDAWRSRATQWFIVSDLALTSLSGADGVHVFLRSLESAAPLAGARLALIARNNEVLGEARSDREGHALFAPGLARGQGGAAPALITAATEEGDYAFLDLTGPAFDLSDRGVEGRPAPPPIDVFVYTERGIYRPGEAVHAVALARDDKAVAVGGLPLNLILRRPDGVEYRRFVVADSGLGGHYLQIDLPANAMRGTWQLAAHADPDAPALAEGLFLVEDFLPDRIEFDLTASGDVLPRGGAVTGKVEGRFLYGAPAAGLSLEGELTLRAAESLGPFPGFSFALAGEETTSLRQPLFGLPQTDGQGAAAFQVAAGEMPETAGPIEAELTLRMREGGGRAVERSLTLPVTGEGPYLGIRPLFAEGRTGEGEEAGFEVIAVNGAGARIALPGVEWQLLKVNRSWQWYRVNGAWSYEPFEATSRVADGRLDIGAGAPARLSVPTEWGDYRLVLSAQNGTAESGIAFASGWHVAAATADTPDSLQVGLDRASYAPGDSARISFTAREAGRALVAVMAEKLVATREIEVEEGRVDVDVPVTEDWGTGAYVSVTLLRGSKATGHQPARAIGLAWAGIEADTRTLAVEFEVLDLVRPAETLELPLRVSGLKPGETAKVVVAAVDVGILNVTAYEPPAPEDWYFGQRRLGMEIRDLYGRLIDGAAASAGSIRSGGDMAELAVAASPPDGDPVALFSGVVSVDNEGRAAITFDIPQFNGTLRLMAVAWSATSVGHGSADVTVRDPVVVTASLPRFLSPGDAARLRLDIDNRDGPAGAYRLELAGTGGVTVGEESRELMLAQGERTSLSIPIAGASVGKGGLHLRLASPEGSELTRDLALAVRAPQPEASERRLVSIAPGETFNLTAELLAGLVPGSGSVSLSVSPAARLDPPALLQALDRYPYGCAEQITSRALPLLYLSGISAAIGLGDDQAVRGRIQGAISGLLNYQAANGGFGLWGPGSGNLWLDSYVTDFLGRAAAQGFEVPQRALGLAFDNLANTMAYTDEGANGGADTAYALYVLARNRRAAIGDLRYYADSRLEAFAAPLARAQLAAALALYGEKKRAEATFKAGLERLAAEDGEIEGRGDYGSRLRDGAAMLTLAAEAGAPLSPAPRLVDFVAAERDRARTTSTQENAWLLMAASGLISAGAPADVLLDGVPITGALMRRFDGAALAQNPVALTNRGSAPLEVVLTITGVPEKAAPAGGNGFEITRHTYTLEGEPADPKLVNQNERLIVVLEVVEAGEAPSNVLVVDMLPAGFEIANPALIDSADLSALTWLPEKPQAARLEFRDDRFVAAFERSGSEPRAFTLAYMVRAVTPGRFALPPALVEDMYRPYLNARTASGRIEVIGIEP